MHRNPGFSSRITKPETMTVTSSKTQAVRTWLLCFPIAHQAACVWTCSRGPAPSPPHAGCPGSHHLVLSDHSNVCFTNLLELLSPDARP